MDSPLSLMDSGQCSGQCKLLKIHAKQWHEKCFFVWRMGIQRPDIKKKKQQRQWIAGGVGILLLAVAALFISRLKPAAPTVDRATVWTDTVKQGPLLRQVR